jgi:two-component system sensor histidine kinase BaeS
VRRPGRSLGTRLVVAMLLVSVVVLGLSYATTYFLVRKELQENALTNLRERTTELRPLVIGLAESSPSSPAALGPRLRQLRRDLRAGLKITDLTAVLVGPNGDVHSIGTASVFTLPPGITAADLDTGVLYGARPVSGRHGNTVFLAIPARLIGRQRLVVIATAPVDTKVLSRATPLLLLAGIAVLVLAVGVAIWVARRLTRPIRELERAAGQLAAGDLSGRADIPPGTDADLAALGTTLNAMAAQLEDSRGSQRAFLLSISHDLRTPLTSIRGYAEALADGTLDDADPEARKRAATVIGGEARRLERLVGDLLDLSRLDSRQFSLNPRQCDAAHVVGEAALAFAPQARELGLELRVLAGDPAPAFVDPDRLGQIVANLVENALKYATSIVEVSTDRRPGELAVVVIDDGPGIPPDDLANVFTRLYTVRATPGRAVGTGLGLAIVQELAGAMGGRAVADVPPSGGARITVWLPAGGDEAVA